MNESKQSLIIKSSLDVINIADTFFKEMPGSFMTKIPVNYRNDIKFVLCDALQRIQEHIVSHDLDPAKTDAKIIFSFVDITETSSRGHEYYDPKKLISALENGNHLVPILLSPDGTVIDGHHRRKAYAAIGSKKIPTFQIKDIKQGNGLVSFEVKSYYDGT